MYLRPLRNEVAAGYPLEITNFPRRQPRDFAPNFVIFARAATGSTFSAATECEASARVRACEQCEACLHPSTQRSCRRGRDLSPSLYLNLIPPLAAGGLARQAGTLLFQLMLPTRWHML